MCKESALRRGMSGWRCTSAHYTHIIHSTRQRSVVSYMLHQDLQSRRKKAVGSVRRSTGPVQPISHTTSYSRDSSVGIATRYGLDGPGIESRWGKRFSAPVHAAHSASCTMGTGSFPGVKRPRRCVDHPPPSSVEVEGRVELYIYSTYEPSSPVIG